MSTTIKYTSTMVAFAAGSPLVLPDPNPVNRMLRTRSSPILLSLVYAIGAAAWIVFSDRALDAIVPDRVAFSNIGTIKGLGFVAASTLLLWTILRRHHSRLGDEVASTLRSEEALRAQALSLETALQAANLGFWHYDLATGTVTADERASIHFGLPHGPLAFNDVLARVRDEDRERLAREFSAATNPGGTGRFSSEFRVVHPDRQVRWLLVHVRFVFDGDEGGRWAARGFGTSQDITERKRSETALRESEERLRQAQKMEAVGQLAGGVAHDFNNILMVIQGHAELMATEPGISDGVRDSCREISRATERAAGLTRQLLVFSRRQVMQFRELDLNPTVAETARMLRRVLGENIELLVRCTPTPLTLNADPGMIDMALLNLAVNARDAMPDGGMLVLETSLVQRDGRPFACMDVRDTGRGIPPEDLPRIFEPFFTTKEVGKGTGLGLATAFGVVREHGGFIEVNSEVGRGTTFRLLFPLIDGAPHASDPSNPDALRGGTETLLLVEDERSVRSLLVDVLSGLGYRVIEAENGVQALALARGHGGEIALAVTDLVMPGGISGLDLGRELAAVRPGTKVIYVSGFSTQTAEKRADLTEGVNFLAKPFSPRVLASMIREQLDAS